VQVQLSTSNNIDVFLEGDLIEFGLEQKERVLPTQKATVVISADRKEVTVSFASGFSFGITVAENSLMLSSVVDARIKGKTRGLLGVFDGHPENDLQAPNGNVIPLNSSLETIHFEFGLKWMIAKEESLFIYDTGKSYDTYKNEKFRPSFALPDPGTMDPEIVEMCDGEFECLYDYFTTESKLLANQSRKHVQQYKKAVAELSREIPMCSSIKAPKNGFINAVNFFVNSTVNFACYNGYQLSGNDNIRCMQDKKWSGEPPTCSNASK